MHRHKPLTVAILVSLLLIGIMWQLLNESAVQHAAASPSAGALTQVPSTPNDFILPGTQPKSLIHSITDPTECMNCHADYNPAPQQAPESRTWQAWQGSMMAQAGRDPLFYAALDVANAGAADAGEFCLRCHMPRGWLEGRSSTPDGSDMTTEDLEGIQCEVCHRMVDPVSSSNNPARDEEILADLELSVTTIGSGQMIVDPEDYRRGPFDIVSDLGFDPHELAAGATTLISPYHQESDLCGTCHDINNPMFAWNEDSQSYEPNPLDEPGDIAQGFPIERTFSEWKLSEYNTPQGVEAPQFGGNKTHVSTCQDCHMRDISGSAGAFFGGSGIVRDDMPLHDLTGGNTWVPQIIPLHPVFSATFPAESPRLEALENGVIRAREMLQKAARLEVDKIDSELSVKVINDSGHKLPTGYVEGRRMWLQIDGYDEACNLVYTSGAYDVLTGVLEEYGADPTLKVYESKQGLSPAWAEQLGLPAGASFHFALNNEIVSDNRIPPRGYTFAEFNASQAAPYSDSMPDPDRYADGQYWDITKYTLPDNVVGGNVRLVYQVASKEYIEFLRDNNPNEGRNNGEILFELWQQSERSKPEIMVDARFGTNSCELFLPSVTRP